MSRNYSSRGKVRVLLNLLSDPAVMVDEKGHFLAANKAFEEITGLKWKQIDGKPFFELDFVLDESKALLLESLKKRVQGASVEPYEAYFTDNMGVKRCVEVKGKKISYAGKPVDLVVFHDITQRKENQRRLKMYAEQMSKLVDEKVKEIRERDTVFRSFFENTLDGMMLTKPDGSILAANPQACQMLGMTEEEIKKAGLDGIVVKDEKLMAALKEREKTGRVTAELTFKRKDGSTFIGEVSSGIFADADGIIKTSITIKDVSERKKMEEAVKQERYMLEAVTENVGAGLAIISKDYRILWANKVMKETSGDCEGKICYSTFNRLTHVCPDCGVKKIFEEGLPIDTHVYTNCDDKGNRFWVELIVTPIRDESGKVVAALELAVNATERKMLENKLKEYSEKLEQLVEERTAQLQEAQAKLLKTERLAAIGELAAMVGHDLRNPMTAIKNAAYYLKKKGTACPEATRVEMLLIIDDAIERANKIVNDLLEYSREIRLELQPCTPRVLLTEALRYVKVPSAIELLDETADAPEMLVDKDKMVRVFVNLIKNAVDAMPSGGMLKVVSRWKADAVELVFSDTGVGIPDEVKARLFNPLVTTKAQGMGFGLAICKRIVEAHRGTIAVESAPGKGATFTITLPLKPKMEVGEEKEWINLPESSSLTTTPTYENP